MESFLWRKTTQDKLLHTDKHIRALKSKQFYPLVMSLDITISSSEKFILKVF